MKNTTLLGLAAVVILIGTFFFREKMVEKD